LKLINSNDDVAPEVVEPKLIVRQSTALVGA
jgi:hypothetical protein